MSYKIGKTIHLNKGHKGAAWIRELADFPGVHVIDDYNKKSGTKRTVVLGDQTFLTVEAAVTAWKEKNVPRP